MKRLRKWALSCFVGLARSPPGALNLACLGIGAASKRRDAGIVSRRGRIVMPYVPIMRRETRPQSTLRQSLVDNCGSLAGSVRHLAWPAAAQRRWQTVWSDPGAAHGIIEMQRFVH